MLRKKDTRKIAMGVVVMVVLLGSGCLQKEGSGPEVSSKENVQKESIDSGINMTVESLSSSQKTLIDRLLQHDLSQKPVGIPNIVQIDEDYLGMMRNNYPAIFDTADVGDYEIRFGNLFVIYDYENDTIEKQYVFKDLKLGG